TPPSPSISTAMRRPTSPIWPTGATRSARWTPTPDHCHCGHSEVSNMLRGYSNFLDVLEKIEKVILAVTVGIMVLIIAYQVIMRYIFAHANSWSEELARYLFIYDVMIGAAIAIRRNSH